MKIREISSQTNRNNNKPAQHMTLERRYMDVGMSSFKQRGNNVFPMSRAGWEWEQLQQK